MITTRQQEKLLDRVKSLSELELDSFFEELSEYIHKNNLSHLVEDRFNLDDLREEVSSLEQTIEDKDQEIDQLQDKVYDISNIVCDVLDVEEFEEEAFDTLKSAIDKINKIV